MSEPPYGARSFTSSRKSPLPSQTKTKSSWTSRSRASDLIKKARLAELKIAQANKEAKWRAEEERKQAKEECRLREKKRRLEEQRQIRELEYEAERLLLEAQMELEQDPESLANRLRDFDNDKELHGLLTVRSVPVVPEQ